MRATCCGLCAIRYRHVIKSLRFIITRYLSIRCRQTQDATMILMSHGVYAADVAAAVDATSLRYACSGHYDTMTRRAGQRHV